MTETRTAILTFAENRESFRFAELLSYLNELFQISKVTLSWYLKEMVNENILFRLGRGIYTTRKVQTLEYTPHMRNRAVKIGKSLARKFPFLSVSVLDGQVFADFQHHVSSNNIIYVEVDREAMQSVFHTLKQDGYAAYLNPSKDFVYDNIDLSSEAVIVKPLVSESPLLEFNGVRTPRLEKILVDIYCDDDLDYLHGNEWSRMFVNAHSMYSINRTAMLRYASRRNARPALEKAIKTLGTQQHA